MSKKKNLIIFDMDQTIVDKDIDYSCIEKLSPDLCKEMDQALLDKVHWIDFNNYLFKRMKKNNVTWEQISQFFKNIELSPKFEELFTYIKNNSSKYDSIVVSGNNEIVINIILESHHIKECFKTILCNKSYFDESNNIIIESVNEKYETCKVCSPFLCKSLIFEDYLKEIKRENYDKLLFIGDGGNDLCLSKKLSEKDYVFPRKHFRLYELLFNENKMNEIKAKICPWENGMEIYDILKNL